MTNILNALIAQSEWAIVLLRIVLGVIFVVHGVPKLKNFKGTAAWLGSSGFKPGWLWAAVVSVAEAVGGICIAVGFYAPIAALVLVVNMIVALFFKISKKAPFTSMQATGWEFDLLLIAALLLLATLGSGSWAIL